MHTAERGPTHSDRSSSRPADPARAVLDTLDRHPVASAFVVALAIRMATSVGVFFVTGGTLFSDDTTYPAMAAAVVEGRSDSWDEYTLWLYNSTSTYTVPLTFLFRLFGTAPLVGMFFTGVLGALTAALAARLVLESLTGRAALAVGLVVAVLPSQVLFSSLTLKDATVWALLAGAAVLVSAAGRSSGWSLAAPLSGLAVILVLLGHVRVHTMVVAAWAIALASLAGIRRHRLWRSGGAALLLLCIPAILGVGPGGMSLVIASQGDLEHRRVANAIGATTAFVETPSEVDTPTEREVAAVEAEIRRLERDQRGFDAQLSELDRQVGVLEERISAAEAEGEDLVAIRLRQEVQDLRARRERIEVRRSLLETRAAELAQAAADGPAAAERGVTGPVDEATSFARDLRHLPTGLVVMLVAPLPWQVDGNPNVRLAALETVVWYPLLLLAFAALPAVRRYGRTLWFPVLVAAAVALMYALTEGNFGTAYRHRGELVWAVVVLAGFGARSVTSLLHRVRRLRCASESGPRRRNQRPSHVADAPEFLDVAGPR
jgi:hypothetical protein